MPFFVLRESPSLGSDACTSRGRGSQTVCENRAEPLVTNVWLHVLWGPSSGGQRPDSKSGSNASADLLSAYSRRRGRWAGLSHSDALTRGVRVVLTRPVGSGPFHVQQGRRGVSTAARQGSVRHGRTTEVCRRQTRRLASEPPVQCGGGGRSFHVKRHLAAAEGPALALRGDAVSLSEAGTYCRAATLGQARSEQARESGAARRSHEERWGRWVGAQGSR